VDGVQESKANMSAWSSMSIASFYNVEARLELDVAVMRLWVRACTTVAGRSWEWQSYQMMRSVEAIVVARSSGPRWYGDSAITHRSLTRGQ
jgi:hypothetical protein